MHIINHAARTWLCRDEHKLRWPLLTSENELLRIIFTVIHFLCILTISEWIWSVSASGKSMKIAGTACLTAKIKILAFYGSSLSQRFSRFQTSRNDQAIVLSSMVPLAKLANVSKVANRNRRPRRLFIFFLLLLLLSGSLALNWVKQWLPNQHTDTCIYLG